MVRWLDPVVSALDQAPAPVRVFFRDDDAGWRDDRLVPLLELFARHGLPLDVAVIPRALGPGLARELRARAGDGLALHQHGLAHVNHEREGRKHEFGPSRGREAQRRDIEAGRTLLRELLGDALEPIFTPPWNRCTGGHRALPGEARLLRALTRGAGCAARRPGPARAAGADRLGAAGARRGRGGARRRDRAPVSPSA